MTQDRVIYYKTPIGTRYNLPSGATFNELE